ncbi:hypothetical protein SV7mr_33030 [Stieleria bergensis]|uniref:Uncharacterized protein n=1 Tax=Stieleria bergensis TaxID=2528025 RepID=A0A517SXA8_9BACT|nr:hypothetical protein SV7mr_33030 [Planctomycetes bacterium SV_7m_r]
MERVSTFTGDPLDGLWSGVMVPRWPLVELACLINRGGNAEFAGDRQRRGQLSQASGAQTDQFAAG